MVLTLALSPVTVFAKTQNESEETKIKSKLQEYFDLELSSIKDKDKDALQDLGKLFNNDDIISRKFLEYEINRSEFLINSHEEDGTEISSFNNKIDILSISIKDKEASVELSLNQSIDYNFLKEPFENEINHKVKLVKENDQWLISQDDYSDNLKELFGFGTDFNSISKLGNEVMSQAEDADVPQTWEEKRLKIEGNVSGHRSSDNVSVLGVPGDKWDRFDQSAREDAVYYARKYTDATNSTSTKNYNNSQFKAYGDTDCQNYVSQAIWYGLGGRDSSSKDYPMRRDWWANTKGETNTWNWTGTKYFFNWITYNDANEDYGIHGRESKKPNLIEIGDYIYVPGHVMFVTRVDDDNDNSITDYEEIYISAHTNNQKDKNLKALYGGASPDKLGMKFVFIYGNKWNVEEY
jgi:hypothetical protein